MTYGFIGCGNMGSALAKALFKTTANILFADHCAEKAEALAAELHGTATDNAAVAAGCDRIFLGVKPQVMGEMLLGIRPILQEKKPLLITMAAGLTVRQIEEMAGTELPVIRIMPNTPVAIGQGMVLCCKNELVSDEVFASFAADLRHAGTLDELDETLIDAGCSVSGCGPAYMYLFLEALAKGAAACGLPREKALRYAAVTMAGAAGMVLASDRSPEELRKAVCSPGGSTLAGIGALEENGFSRAAEAGVAAAYKRNKELGEST